MWQNGQMFENVNFLGTPRKSILLDTREGNRIENDQALPPEQEHLRAYARILAERQNWQPRIGAAGIYNCYGLVWASRRTSIYEQAEIQKILTDDGYRPLRDGEQPMTGDIAVYTSGDRMVHAGLVVGEIAGLDGMIPEILSKINDFGGEVIHNAYDFGESLDRFWTDRP